MKQLCRQLTLFTCLALCIQVVKADAPAQEDFDFLKQPFANATQVENGAEIAGVSSGLALSAITHIAIWWSGCRLTAHVRQLINPGVNLLKEEKFMTKADFCFQLAPLIATTEAMLAGHLSPWPLEPPWFYPLYLGGAVLSASSGYLLNKNPYHIPVALLTYLTAEAASRTYGSAVSASLLKAWGTTEISGIWYAFEEYTALSAVLGVVAAGIACETALLKGASPTYIKVAGLLSAAIASVMSGAVFTSTINYKEKGAVVGFAILSATGALLGALPVYIVAAVNVAGGASAIAAGAVAIAGTLAGAGAGILVAAEGKYWVEATVANVAVAVTIAGTGALTIIALYNTAQKNSAVAAGLAVVLATTFGLASSLSGYVIYGNPLTEQLADIMKTPWKKFFDPPEYFSTMLK